MKCPNCGHENEDSAVICANCGHPLRPGADTTMSMPPVPEPEEDAGERAVTEAPAEAPAEHPALLITKGPFAGERFDLAQGEISLGRDPGSDIFLDDVTVSRRHAKLTVSGDRVEVADAGSLNGTYVNRERVEVRTLMGGDELQIGKFRLVFVRGRGTT